MTNNQNSLLKEFQISEQKCNEIIKEIQFIAYQIDNQLNEYLDKINHSLNHNQSKP